MSHSDAAVAVFEQHADAESAIKKLTSAGFDMKKLSVVGKGFHTDEKVVGFYNMADRVQFWGSRGAVWGALWALFFGGLFLVTPVIGPIIALGYVATSIMAAIEGAVVVGGLSALGAALYSIGIPKDSVVRYESAIEADGFVVMAHGTTEEVARAKAILGTSNPSTLDVHAALVASPITASAA
ncbi:general stress protein [Devosia sp.]|uniref:general stress protein n=1 Tax=Devosia sp. TaxID=1871048 RepID=UPI003264C7C7